MSDNINPYTGDEPVNPYEQQPSYAQDFPESDPYTKDAYNDVFDDTEPVQQQVVAPPPIPGQGYNQNQFNGSAGPAPVQQNPYTGGVNPTPAPQNPYTGGANPTPVSQSQNTYTSAPAPTPTVNAYGQNTYGQNSYGQNTYGQNAYTSPSAPPGSSYETAHDDRGTGGLVCSIISILCCGIILAPIGIALSGAALRDNNQSAKAKAGLLVGVISLILNIVIFILSCIAWGKLMEAAM